MRDRRSLEIIEKTRAKREGSSATPGSRWLTAPAARPRQSMIEGPGSPRPSRSEKLDADRPTQAIIGVGNAEIAMTTDLRGRPALLPRRRRSRARGHGTVNDLAVAARGGARSPWR